MQKPPLWPFKFVAVPFLRSLTNFLTSKAGLWMSVATDFAWTSQKLFKKKLKSILTNSQIELIIKIRNCKCRRFPGLWTKLFFICKTTSTKTEGEKPKTVVKLTVEWERLALTSSPSKDGLKAGQSKQNWYFKGKRRKKIMHLGAGVQAAGRNSGVTGKECQSPVIKLKQKIRPERCAPKEFRTSREMSEIFSLSSHRGWQVGDLASGVYYVCFRGQVALGDGAWQGF